jgi:hypothetical protein
VFASVVQVDLVAFVPPDNVRVPLEVLAVLMETRIFSIEVAVRAQLKKAFKKRVAIVLSKRFGGKSAS